VRAYDGDLGLSLQWCPVAEPLMMGGGVREAKPPEAESVLEIVQNFRLNISRFFGTFFIMFRCAESGS